MIPEAHITAWSQNAPWPRDAQIEQDLILSRFMVEIFEDDLLSDTVAMRGGTAIHKLFFEKDYRYSEDIDLVLLNHDQQSEVMTHLENIGMDIFDVKRDEVGKKRPDVRHQRIFDYDSEIAGTSMTLKVDVNTGSAPEPFDDFIDQKFTVDSPWFSEETKIRTYTLEELLGTKLRALSSRNKGRDLFDLWLSLEKRSVDVGLIIEAFEHYLKVGSKENLFNRKVFEQTLIGKIRDFTFFNDVENLIRTNFEYSDRQALKEVYNQVVTRLPGKPFNSDELDQFFEGNHSVQK